MRPKLLALGAALAVLAALAWPTEPEQALAPAATGSADAAPSAASTMQLVAVGLAAAALAFLLQGVRVGAPDGRPLEEDA